jgi:hypothetical protein
MPPPPPPIAASLFLLENYIKKKKTVKNHSMGSRVISQWTSEAKKLNPSCYHSCTDPYG